MAFLGLKVSLSPPDSPCQPSHILQSTMYLNPRLLCGSCQLLLCACILFYFLELYNIFRCLLCCSFLISFYIIVMAILSFLFFHIIFRIIFLQVFFGTVSGLQINLGRVILLIWTSFSRTRETFDRTMVYIFSIK